MSGYTKLTDTIPDIAAAVANALALERITEDVQQDLLDAGSVVQLIEDGTVIWLASIVHDKPSTPQIDLLTCAIACKDGAPWYKPNGQVVASTWWHAMWAKEFSDLGVDTARKALMMIALGEPQPQVPIPAPAEGGPTEMDAIPDGEAISHSIRTAMLAAAEIDAPLNDVL